jgi:hypothetical protein
MLKLFFWLLLIANGVLLMAHRGYLGTNATERHEPARMALQLQPEALTILQPSSEQQVMLAKPAPGMTTIPCTEIGNFNTAEARKFEIQLARLNLPTVPVLRRVQDASGYMVYIPSRDGRTAADRRATELRRLGIQDFYMLSESYPNPALRWAISLGVFKTETAAKAHTSRLISQGVRGMRIIERHATSIKQAYQWRNIDTVTKAALDSFKTNFPYQEMRACSE